MLGGPFGRKTVHVGVDVGQRRELEIVYSNRLRFGRAKLAPLKRPPARLLIRFFYRNGAEGAVGAIGAIA